MLAKKGRPKSTPEIPVDVSDLDLSLNEQRFVAHYCANGFNGSDAIKKSGFKVQATNSANSFAWQLLQKDNINKAIKMFLDAVLKPFRDKLEYELLNIYYRRATYSVSMFVDKHGRVKTLDDIPDEWHCCIDGVERKIYGKDATREVVTYQLPNRDMALNKLFDYVSRTAPTDSPDEIQRARENVANIFADALANKIKTKDAVTITQKRISKNNMLLADKLEKQIKKVKK